jgi:hypothetical protein
MSIIMHPLTALAGSPAYSADDYRRAVNPFLVPSNGSAFNCVAGVRVGSPSPLCSISGLTVTVKPHCGVCSPWANAGSYTYAFTANETVNVPDSTGNYKIAIVVEDPSRGQGSVPRGLLKVFPYSTANAAIPGLVIAEVSAGTISETAPRLRDSTVVTVTTDSQLKSISAVSGQRAFVAVNNRHYVMRDGKWQDSVEVQKVAFNSGEIVILYGRDLCSVQVNGVVTDAGSWASAVCPTKIREGYRPLTEVSAPLMTENGASNTGLIVVVPEGTISVKNMGSSGSAGKRRGNVSWPVC